MEATYFCWDHIGYRDHVESTTGHLDRRRFRGSAHLRQEGDEHEGLFAVLLCRVVGGRTKALLLRLQSL